MASRRATAIVAVGFAAAVALAAVVLVIDPAHTDATVVWRRGVALPRPVPVGDTVVDGRIPVSVLPDVAAWTGSELLTFGSGRRRGTAGAVYDAVTGRWRATNEAPFGTVLAGAQAVWTGNLWVVAGVLCSASVPGRDDSTNRGCDPGTFVASAYRPDRDAWRTIDARPFPIGDFFLRGHAPRFGAAIGMLGSGAVFVIDGQYYAFHPDSWEWEWLPQPSASDTLACAVDGTLVRYEPGKGGVSVLTADASSWRSLAGQGSGVGNTNLRTVCTRDGFVVYTPDLDHVARFDARREQWSVVPRPPSTTEPVGSATFVGDGVLFHGGAQSLLYEFVDGWRPAAAGLAVPPSRVTWRPDGTGVYVSNRELRAYRAA